MILGLSLGMTLSMEVGHAVKAANGVVTVHYIKGYGIALWNSPNANHHPIAGRKLAHGTAWKFSDTKKVGSKTWYELGKNQWADGSYLTLKGTSGTGSVSNAKTTQIKFIPGWAVGIYPTPDTLPEHVYHYIKPGTTIKILETGKDKLGEELYRYGTNKWVKAKYTVAGAPAIKKTGKLQIFYKPGYGIVVRTSPNGPIKQPIQYYNTYTVFDFTDSAVINGTPWYKIDDNQWIDGRYVWVTTEIEQKELDMGSPSDRDWDFFG